MKKPKITEGEWELVKDNVSGLYNEDGCFMTLTGSYTDCEAISAVPEMIDALIAVKKELESIKTEDYGYHLNKVNEALKKAGVKL